MEKSIEFYKENGKYCVWIAAENESGYKCSADTIEELAEQVKDYITDYGEELFD